ncbi:MAG: T9SS type A sorting domain-containing protein [Bacteroidota bacterium]
MKYLSSFLVLSLALCIGHGQSLGRYVVGSGSQCVTQGFVDYDFHLGEAMIGTDQSTLPALTMGFAQPLDPTLLEVRTIKVRLETAPNGEILMNWDVSVALENGAFSIVEEGENGNSVLSMLPADPFQTSYQLTLPNRQEQRVRKFHVRWKNTQGQQLKSNTVEYFAPSRREKVVIDAGQKALFLRELDPQREYDLFIYDMRGKICLQRRITQESVSLAQLSSGIYLLQLRSGRGKLEQKILLP